MTEYAAPAHVIELDDDDEDLKKAIGFDFPSAVTAGTEAALAARVARAIGWRGKSLYKKDKTGRKHVILYGSRDQRPNLPGTRYSANNAKIIAAGIGPVAARRAAFTVGIVGIVVYTGYDIFRFLKEDKITMTELFGKIGADIAKVTVGAAAGYAIGVTASAIAATAGLTIAIPVAGTVVIGIVVSIGVGLALDALDKQFKITEKLQAVAEELYITGKSAPGSLANLTTRQQKEIINRAYLRAGFEPTAP
ncbi:MAG: hypothetical protein HQ481_02065 [Alphaproteobacteria bacterium]|nr:hypothetical protein [Alphaproteobacteria bacterium]